MHSMPTLGGSHRNVVIPFSTEKLEWFGFCEKSLRICLAASTKYWRVTDRRTVRRTDGRTDGQTNRQTGILPQHSPRYAYASRDNNAKLK